MGFRIRERKLDSLFDPPRETFESRLDITGFASSIRHTLQPMASLNSTPPGVNVYGYLHAASGVGQHTRLLIRALESAKVPFGAQA